jgi:hypothetical protein
MLTRTWPPRLLVLIALSLAALCPAIPATAQDDPFSIYLPLATKTAAPAPPPAPPPPGAEVAVRNLSGLYDLGDYILYGEVANALDVPIYNVELSVTYYDASGVELAAGEAAPVLHRIEASSTAPLHDIHFGAPAGIARVQVEVTGFDRTSLVDYRHLSILTTNQRLGAGGVVVSGVFRNDTGKRLNSIVLAASFREPGGKVVSVVYDYPVIGSLLPGRTYEYTIETFDDSLAGTTALVQGEGQIEP